jgi:hypothetical protein
MREEKGVGKRQVAFESFPFGGEGGEEVLPKDARMRLTPLGISLKIWGFKVYLRPPPSGGLGTRTRVFWRSDDRASNH